MSGFNRVVLFGNLGQDPELRMTNGGTAVLSIRMATSESYQDRNGERKERTEWHTVVVWGKRAEALGRFLSKGAKVLVEGSLRTSSYEGRDGNKRYKTEVVAQDIVLAGRGGSEGGGRSERQQGSSSADSYADADYSLEEDIPF